MVVVTVWNEKCKKLPYCPSAILMDFIVITVERHMFSFEDEKAPMVGNICMDYMMVDVTDIPCVTVGDKVLIFGEDEFGYYLSPEELANRGDSIVHELITCLGPRIQRIFVHEEGKEIR